MSHIIHTNDTNKHEGTSLATSKEEKKEDFEIFTATDLANVVAYSTMAVGNNIWVGYFIFICHNKQAGIALGSQPKLS